MRTLSLLGAAMRICVFNEKQSTSIEAIVKKNVCVSFYNRYLPPIDYRTEFASTLYRTECSQPLAYPRIHSRSYSWFRFRRSSRVSWRTGTKRSSSSFKSSPNSSSRAVSRKIDSLRFIKTLLLTWTIKTLTWTIAQHEAELTRLNELLAKEEQETETAAATDENLSQRLKSDTDILVI